VRSSLAPPSTASKSYGRRADNFGSIFRIRSINERDDGEIEPNQSAHQGVAFEVWR
jgi:hypothetical protein